MDNKIIIGIVTVLTIISGVTAYGISHDSLEDLIFDKMKYNYTSHVWIPPNSPKAGSLGGYYKINGQGQDFTFMIKLPGAEKAESPLDYTKEGLNGTGKLDSIQITFETIHALIFGDFKKAMFETKFRGNFNMTCAAWNGTGTFSSDNGTIPGTFKIDGPMTDWEGTFIVRNENRITLTMDYIYYPNLQINKAKKVTETIYM
ncbi:hypothetical protein [Methanobacterium sp. ACI-7]|uniref:hypothetical protein n=1 Tax=unclassified Methanobacterium TaxID=2627676 RepID=UPI0039C38A95